MRPLALLFCILIGAAVFFSWAALADVKRYSTMMEALGRSGTTPQQLDDLEAYLSGTGTRPADAEQAIFVVIRNPGIVLSYASILVPLARDIGAVMGNDIVRETRELTDALTGNADTLTDYCLSRNAITVEDVTTMLGMMRKGQRPNAAKLAIDRLATRFTGKYEQLRATAPPR